MSEVSVIGLGAMGSALARALLRGGHRVTVWNRTATKADPLVREGAVLAPNPTSAVAASPVVLICVDSYAVSRAILSEPNVKPNLSGRILIQLTTGSPQEARESELWSREAGARYLDCAILAYPDQIGKPDAALLVAGEETCFRGCEPLLTCLAGGLTWVGEPIGAASALDCAALSFVFGALLGALHGARICEVEGLRVDEFGSMLADLVPVVGGEVKQLTERIQTDRYAGSQAALRTYAAAAVRLVAQARDGGINPDFPTYASAAFQKGMNAGFGNDDLASVIKTLRAHA